MRVLLDAEKMEFVSKSVSWIQGQDIMDTCFILNFGYEAPLPWPQVYIHNICKNFQPGINYVRPCISPHRFDFPTARSAGGN